jgi:hypothetical protein
VFNTNHGDDVVTDFVSGTDTLQFSASMFATAANVVAAFSSGAITTSDGTVTLIGITSITEADIDIV